MESMTTSHRFGRQITDPGKVLGPGVRSDIAPFHPEEKWDRLPLSD